jgi:hypothetical protein
MKINKIAAQEFLDELTKSNVVVTFYGDWCFGRPVINPFERLYTIEKREIEATITSSNKVIKVCIDAFQPFSIIINNKFKTSEDYPFEVDQYYRPHINNLRDKVIDEINYNYNVPQI